MGIESNKEAMAMMRNALGSIENRFREAYNKGYKDGLRDGASQVTAKLVSKILEENEADTPQTEDYDLRDEQEYNDRWSTDCDRYVITNDEGDKAYNCIGCTQTDCSWK